MSKNKKTKQPEVLAAIPENMAEETVSSPLSENPENKNKASKNAITGADEDTSKNVGTIVQEDEKVIAYFKGNKIPYCKKCLRQFRTSFDGLKICSANYSKEECPNLHD